MEKITVESVRTMKAMIAMAMLDVGIEDEGTEPIRDVNGCVAIGAALMSEAFYRELGAEWPAYEDLPVYPAFISGADEETQIRQSNKRQGV